MTIFRNIPEMVVPSMEALTFLFTCCGHNLKKEQEEFN